MFIPGISVAIFATCTCSVTRKMMSKKTGKIVGFVRLWSSSSSPVVVVVQSSSSSLVIIVHNTWGCAIVGFVRLSSSRTCVVYKNYCACA